MVQCTGWTRLTALRAWVSVWVCMGECGCARVSVWVCMGECGCAWVSVGVHG